MYYEINVSNTNGHLFATSERSIKSMFELKQVYFEIRKRFPEADGWKLTITKWIKEGTRINEGDLIQ